MASHQERADAVMLERLIRYLQWIEESRYGLTVEEIRRNDEVGDKTVRRVLATMANKGWIESTTRSGQRNKKYWIVRKVPPIQFSRIELLSLSLGQQMMQPLAGTPLYAGFHSLLAKVKAQSPEDMQEPPRWLLRNFHVTAFGQSDYSGKTELISDLFDAANNRRVLSMKYQKADAEVPKQYLIHPYAIFFHNGSIYLVAYSVEARDKRHFKIDRMLSTAQEREKTLNCRQTGICWSTGKSHSALSHPQAKHMWCGSDSLTERQNTSASRNGTVHKN